MFRYDHINTTYDSVFSEVNTDLLHSTVLKIPKKNISGRAKQSNEIYSVGTSTSNIQAEY
jgi:hypothetical protein